MAANGSRIIEAINESDENSCIVVKGECEEVDDGKDKGVNESIIAHKNKIFTAIEAEKCDAHRRGELDFCWCIEHHIYG
eukprot:15347512-Ditylum_brightwellii.AAC.1